MFWNLVPHGKTIGDVGSRNDGRAHGEMIVRLISLSEMVFHNK